MCNPPCPEGEGCVDGRVCEPASAPAGIYEPPPPPPKKPGTFAERIHSALGFHLGFSGKHEVRGPDASVRSELDTTYGVNLRSDVPVARYLLLGPLFQFGAYRVDRSPKPSRDYYVDIDLYVRGRLPIEVDKLALQLWAGMPIGLTLGFLGATTAGESGDPRALSGFGVGWNVGFLVGGAIHFSKKFGMFAEAGWVAHRTSHAYENRDGDVSIRLSQTNVNLGFIFSGK